MYICAIINYNNNYNIHNINKKYNVYFIYIQNSLTILKINKKNLNLLIK